LAAARASRVDACFATQLQDVSDLLDWWLAQANAVATSSCPTAPGLTGDDKGCDSGDDTSPAVATQVDVVADVTMAATQVSPGSFMPYSSDDESYDSDGMGCDSDGGGGLDEDGRQVLDAVIASYAGSSTRRHVLQDGRGESSDDGCDADGDGSDAINLDGFDDDDDVSDDDEDSDDGFFVHDDDGDSGVGKDDDNDDDDSGVGKDDDNDDDDSGVGDNDDNGGSGLSLDDDNDDDGGLDCGGGDSSIASHHYRHSSEDSRYEGFFSTLRGAALGQPLVCEAVAMRAIRTGSLVEFSTNEVERHLQRAVDELRIMRSRGNIYFV
jgi:hypothetical protein